MTANGIFHIHALGVRYRVRAIKGGEDANLIPLVFLHEGLGCIEMWRDFPDRLCRASGRAGIVFDRRGYGGSDHFAGKWPLDYLVHEGKTALPSVLDACGIEKAVLFGHSDGGTIALMAAALAPSRVAAGITEAAHIFVEDITLEGIRRAVDTYKTSDLKSRLEKYHHKNTDTVFWRWADTWLDPAFSSWNMTDILPKIHQPFLVIQGKEDEYGTKAQVEGICRGVSGNAESLIIPDCGHIPHVFARKTVLEAAVTFLKYNGSARSFPSK